MPTIITNKEIESIIPTGLKIILDSEYIAPNDEQVIKIVGDFVKKRGAFNYKENSHDCDNAAFEMLIPFSGLGFAFGVAILDGHSANLYINDKKKMKYIEPQTGELFITSKRLKITVMP